MRNIEKAQKLFNNYNVEFLVQDVSHPINYNGTVDFIIHAASPASPLIMKDKPVETIAANALGTYYTLSLANDKKCEGYLFISSREIYGQPYEGQNVFTEDVYGFVDPLNPRSCYPEGKKAAETMCASFKEEFGLNAKIARLAHTYGPGMSIYDGRVQADFLKNVLFDEDIVLKSEGKSIRTYTYISDAIVALFYILLNGTGMVYNIGNENAKVSIKELAEILASLKSDKKISLKFELSNSSKDGTAPFTDGILSSQKLRELGWKPKYDVRDGFSRTLKYLEIEKDSNNL